MDKDLIDCDRSHLSVFGDSGDVLCANLAVDLSRLVDHLNHYVLPLPIQQQSTAFGGWSVFSSNGSYLDGWHKGHSIYFESCPIKAEEIRHRLGFVGKKYDQPTEICHSYLGEVMDQISGEGYSPSRARIILLPQGKESVWHRDAPDDVPFYRLHIPIVTNENCLFVTEKESVHLPADGRAYIVRVNHPHRVVNGGDTDRFHLVMDIEFDLDKRVIFQC